MMRTFQARVASLEPAAPKRVSALEHHISISYASLRRGMAVIAWFFPAVLWWHGNAFGIDLQDSMSHYYHAEANPAEQRIWDAIWVLPYGLLSFIAYRLITGRGFTRAIGLWILVASVGYVAVLLFLDFSGWHDRLILSNPMRTVFIGVLCVLGAFLYLYRGFSVWEHLFLSGAGLCAVLVALFPMKAPTAVSDNTGDGLHFAFAVGFYVLSAAACLCCARITLDDPELWPPDAPARTGEAAIVHPTAYRRFYWVAGGTMVVVGLAGLIIKFAYSDVRYVVFIVETVGMLAFAAYWWVKSDELKQTQADRPGKLPETSAEAVAEAARCAEAARDVAAGSTRPAATSLTGSTGTAG